jgi:transcriptional regulator with PAS, ATPase and Fis domain
LLEAELFGYKKGAFTGAIKDRDGAFKRLNGGTLFLDEIGECSLELQAKLLRVLQPPPGKALSYREFYPVGSEQPEHSDVRIISATNRNLPEMIARQQFRDDLFYRLSAITLPLPPLRERKGDALLLAEKLLQRINSDFKRELPGYNDKYFCESTKLFIQKHPWHGNVRELFNAILQGVVMASDKKIEIFDMGFPAEMTSVPSPVEDTYFSNDFSLDNTLKIIEKQYITSALKQSGGNKSKAARLLGFSNYQRLDARIKKLKIQPELE